VGFSEMKFEVGEELYVFAVIFSLEFLPSPHNGLTKHFRILNQLRKLYQYDS
jgi:hypothetical protein